MQFSNDSSSPQGLPAHIFKSTRLTNQTNTWRSFTRALVLLTCFTSFSIEANATSSLDVSKKPNFEYHNHFSLNLFGFLLEASKNEKLLSTGTCAVSDSASEQDALREAVTFYRTAMAQEKLFFYPDVQAINEILASAPDQATDVRQLALAEEHKDALRKAAPAYAKCWWPEHQKQNQLWIESAQVKDAKYGKLVAAKVTQWLGQDYPARVRVDVMRYTGHFAGAYTVEQFAHTVIPSSRENYREWAALEMLYHEAAHIKTIDTVVNSINAKLTNGQEDPGLWHAVQFFTVGEAVREILAKHEGIEYIPYYFRGLSQRPPQKQFPPMLTADWQAFMRNEISREDAIDRMVKKLSF